MKAFISHSSKDKHFVRPIADELGEMRCEFDEYTFEYTLNAQAIRSALKRCDLFVFILSKNSINSAFVHEELRTTLEKRASGRITDVIIFAIDETSYTELPEWLRDLNVVHRLRSPKQVATRIDARLTEIALQGGEISDFYFGRAEEEKEIRQIFARPRKESALAIHVVGHSGVGRRTFLRNALKTAAPRHYSSFLEIEIDEYDSVDEVYRKLYELMEVFNPLTAGQHFEGFGQLSMPEKAQLTAKYLLEMADSEIFPIFIDDHGDTFQDNGDYQAYLPLVIDKLADRSRPIFGIVQSRMMKRTFKQSYPRSAHISVGALSDETVFELMCLKLKDLDVDFEIEKVRKAQKYTDGHPYNINLVTAFIADEGVDYLLQDPSEIIESKIERGNSFLRQINFNSDQADIIALLHEYHSCELEFIIVALGKNGSDIAPAVRHLEDYCCVERRDKIITVAPPIRDAVRRDSRFRRSGQWLTDVGRRIVTSMQELDQNQTVSLSFIDAALPELLRQKAEIPFVTALILPSHFLRVARDAYDRQRWRQAVEFANRAIEGSDRLSADAKIEANRLLGLALTRLNPLDQTVDKVVSRLRGYAVPTATRVALFIEGFRSRRLGQYDIAIQKFEQAAEMGRENYHINRELSYVLCKQERFAEAEPYARAAYSRSPDNPYIVDVLVEALEGKRLMGLPVDPREISRLDDELFHLCQAGDFQFHAVRKSRRLYRDSKKIEAFDEFNTLKRQDDPDLLFRRGQMYVLSNDVRAARKDVTKLYTLAEKKKEVELYADQLEAECLIAESRFPDARKFIEVRFQQVSSIRNKLLKSLARAIGYAPGSATQDLKEWARRLSA